MSYPLSSRTHEFEFVYWDNKSDAEDTENYRIGADIVARTCEEYSNAYNRNETWAIGDKVHFIAAPCGFRELTFKVCRLVDAEESDDPRILVLQTEGLVQKDAIALMDAINHTECPLPATVADYISSYQES